MKSRVSAWSALFIVSLSSDLEPAPVQHAASPDLTSAVTRPNGGARQPVDEHIAAPRRHEEPSVDPPMNSGCPEGMVAVDDFCIDRYEAHLLARSEDGSLEPHPPHERPVGRADFVARSEPGVLPQAYISRTEAAQACANSGKRLCSVKEWYGACQGPDATTYPYGPRFESGRCNVGKPHLLSLLYGTNARAWKYDQHFNNPGLDQMAGFLAKTGHFEGCTGPFGIYDMVGNLHEWVADPVDASLTHRLPLRSGIRRNLRRHVGNGIFMGGFFSTTNQHGRGCRFVTVAHEPGYHDYSTGFRCCRDR